MRIKHLLRQDINDEAWDSSIANSINPRVYALSWYLDVVTDGCWNALVSDDYQYVFPLPFNRKLLGYAQVVRPLLCQQLGLFGPAITQAMVSRFVAAIPPAYRRVRLSLNSSCYLPGLTARTNMELAIGNMSGQQLYAGYSKTLQKRIRRAGKKLRVIPSTDIPLIVALFQAQIGNRINWTDREFQQTERCLARCMERRHAKAYLVIDQESEAVVAGGCFIIGFDRITNLFGGNTEAGVKNFATHLMLHTVLEQHLKNVKTFDFEGSDLPGVAEFFRRYNAERVPYYDLEREKLPLAIKWLLKSKEFATLFRF